MDGWSCIGVDKYANSKYRKGTAIPTSIHAFIDFFIYLHKESKVLKCYEKKVDFFTNHSAFLLFRTQMIFPFMRVKKKFI